MGKTRTIKQQTFIHAPADKVFRALTDPRLLKKWFLQSARIYPRKGGNYTFTWQGGYSHSGKVLAYARHKSLSLSWPAYWKGKPLGTTRASFRLRPKDSGTVVTMTHSGFKNGDKWIQTYGGTCSGWAYFLTNLKSVLQYGRDLRSPHDNI